MKKIKQNTLYNIPKTCTPFEISERKNFESQCPYVNKRNHPPKYHMLYPPSKISGPVDKIEHEQPFKFAYTDNPRKNDKPVE
jgi:hypothetical protein